jgi:hypothetical protein
MGLVCVLALAAALDPDPRGWGTHQQLGLPPCTFAMLFHRRCPSCGMTTAWANVLHGRIAAALQANACGALLVMAALAGAAWCLAAAVRGRWVGVAPSEKGVALAAVTIVSLVLVEWGVRLLVVELK